MSKTLWITLGGLLLVAVAGVCLTGQNGCYLIPKSNEAQQEEEKPEKEELPDLTNLTPPTQKDIDFAKSLDKEIVGAVFKYLRDRGYAGYKLRLIAARRINSFILLDVSTGKPDGNIHLVYSVKNRSVIKTFVWYIQG